MSTTKSAILTLLLCTGCSAYERPANLEPVAEGTAYQAQWREPDVSRGNGDYLRSAAMNAQSCLPLGYSENSTNVKWNGGSMHP